MTKRKSAEQKAKMRQEALEYFNGRYGTNMDRLTAWRDLCEDMGVDVGSSINKCKEVRKPVFDVT